MFFDIDPYGMQTHTNVLRYANIDEAIRLARLSGMTTIRIVRALSGSTAYAEALTIARKAAPILGLTTKTFMEVRRNGTM